MELLVEVIGMKCFKGTIDGKSMDSGMLYGIVKLDERHNRIDATGTNWKFGHAVEEWKLPSSDHAMRLKHLSPSIKAPVMLRLDVERVSNGRESVEVVVDAVPVDRSGKPIAAPMPVASPSVPQKALVTA